MLGTRVKSGALFLAVVCLFLGLSHIPGILELGTAMLCAAAMGEFAAAAGVPSKGRMRLLGLVCGGVLARIPGTWMVVFCCVLLPMVMLAYRRIMADLPERKALYGWEKVLIGTSITVFLSLPSHLQREEFGLLSLSLSLLVCVATDSFAYLIGRQFGRHPLAPRISPKKTVEGAVGGSLAAAVLLTAIFAAGECFGLLRVRFGMLTVYVLLASVLGQYGDLCLSAVKRVAGIKDFGRLLPGHGGVLDRFDSHLLVLPFSYVIFTCFGGVFY